MRLAQWVGSKTRAVPLGDVKGGCKEGISLFRNVEQPIEVRVLLNGASIARPPRPDRQDSVPATHVHFPRSPLSRIQPGQHRSHLSLFRQVIPFATSFGPFCRRDEQADLRHRSHGKWSSASFCSVSYAQLALNKPNKPRLNPTERQNVQSVQRDGAGQVRRHQPGSAGLPRRQGHRLRRDRRTGHVRAWKRILCVCREGRIEGKSCLVGTPEIRGSRRTTPRPWANPR